jgi:hypothetical protein
LADKASARDSPVDGNLVERLVSAGHDVEVLPDGYFDLTGHAGASIPMELSKAPTIRAPTAARRGCKCHVIL